MTARTGGDVAISLQGTNGLLEEEEREDAKFRPGLGILSCLEFVTSKSSSSVGLVVE